MIRGLLTLLAVFTLSQSSFAAEPYSAHCTDANAEKITLIFYPGETIRMLAAFAQDEEGWPYAVEFAPASAEEVGTLTLPEGYGLYVGAAPDETGTGIRRFILVPMNLNPYKFSAFHGSHYADQPIVLENKIAMNCF